MFHKRIVFFLAFVIGIGATTKLSAQCTAPTSATGTYCSGSGQYAEYTIVDPSSSRYHWYEKEGTQFKDRGYGQDGNGRNYVSTGTVSGASTYYYTKETDADIGPAYRAPVGGITTVMNVAGYKMPFTSTLDFKINAVTVVVKMTSTTKKYGFQIMHKAGITEEFSDWVTGTLAELIDLGAESVGPDLYKVEIPVTNISVLKGKADTLEFRSVANAGLNEPVDGVYWYSGTAFTGGSYLSTVTLANPKQTISAADRTPLIMDWKTTVLCEKVAVTSTLSTNCCTPVPSTFKVSTSSYSTFPATLTASGTVLTAGLSYFWYNEDNALLGSGTDKKTQVITKEGTYTLKVVGNASNINKFSCVGKKIVEILAKSINTFKDTTICIGQPFLLTASGAEGEYKWSSPNNTTANASLETPTKQSSKINLTTPGTYLFEVSGKVKKGNIAYDGKFERYDDRTNYNIQAFPPSFETTYGNTNSNPIGDYIKGNNEFRVDSKIVAWSTGAQKCPTSTNPTYWQKTTSTGETVSRGNIFYADATTLKTQTPLTDLFGAKNYLWQLSGQTVTPNTDYEFSMDVSEWNASTNPDIMLLVNGVALDLYIGGNMVTTPTKRYWTFDGTPCTWKTLIGKWNSGSNTTATITVSEVSNVDPGHEFAMDDITFSSGFETQKDTVLVTIADCNSLTAKADSVAVCAGSLVNLSATTNGFVEKWEDAAGANLGSTTSIKAYPSATTIYKVTAKFPTKSLGLNGNFEEGYNGFTSGLKPQSGAQIDNENYKIVKGNESFWTNNTGALVPFTDHSGTGSMLVTRTANDHRTKVLYSQTVLTTMGKQYGVSFYLKNILANLNTSAPVDLQINIDGVNKLDINHPLSNNWEFYSYLFPGTGAPTKIDIVGRDTYNTYLFRLLAFDDIVIAEAGLPKVANVRVSTKDCDILTARTDTTQCIGKEVKLFASTNGFITKWTPSTGLSDVSIPNPKLTVSTTQTYTVEAQFPLKRFITNSDFNEGNIGFGSGLQSSGTNNPNDNQYMIGNGNDQNLNNPFTKPTKDHTTGTGTGLFMIAKTKSDNIQVVINQNIATTTGKLYGISFWATDMHVQPENTTNVVFQIRIGGNLIPKTFTIPQNKIWHKIEYTWTATTTANVLVEIINPKETQTKEHAFGLDDLVISELGNTKKKDVKITAKDCSSLTPMAGKEVCIGDPVTLTATTDGVITGWGPASLVSNTTIPNPKVYPVLASNEYTVTAKFPAEKLFSNPDFEAGDVGFTSSLTPSATQGEGKYMVTNGSNPTLYDPFLSTIKDHTTGSGKFLILQTKASTEQVVFSKDITLMKDSSYSLSFFMYDMHTRPNNSVDIEMQIKVGTELVRTFTISKLTADKKWQGTEYTWTAKTSGLVTISLVIPSKITNSLAIGIDDFSITRLGGKKTANVTITTKDCFVLKAFRVGTCQGDSIKVVAQTNGLFAGWKVKTGAAIIKNPMSDTTWVKPSEPTVLEVAAEFTLGNLVSNGDFEGGQDVGYTSGYIYRTPTIDQGYYTLTTNSKTANTGYFFQIPDHTTGDYTGNMMVIDPSTTPDVTAYSTKVTVKNGAKYAISAWVASLHTGYANPPVLQFFINNNPLGVLDADSLPVWRQFYSTWTANLDGEIEIKVVNKNNQGGGNDYALDDIEFTEISSVPRTITLPVPACIVCKKVISGALSSSKPTICTGENTTITGALPSQETNTANTFTYKWEKREGTGTYVEIPLATGKDYTTPVLTQTTTFRRTARGLLSCSDTANTTITVNPKPSKPKVTGDTTLCVGEKLDLKATSTGTIKNYTWTGISGATFGNSSGTLNDLMTKASVTSTDSVKIKIVATSTDGCKDSSNVLVAVYKNPTRPIFTGDSVLCENAKLDIKATSLAAKGVTVKGYTWKGFTASNGIAITNSTGTLQDKIGKTSVTNAENNLAIKVIVESMVGCKDSSNVKLTINPSPTKPSVTTNATCQDSIVKFNGSPLDANHAFVWYDTDTITNSAPISKPNPSTVNVVPPKVYYVSQKNSTTNCESKKDSVWVTIKPRTSITTNPKLLDSLCEGEPYTINVVAGGSGPFSYQWSKNGKDTSGFTNAELKLDPIKPTDAGTYKVKVTGACGAPSSQNAVLVVKTKPVIITEPKDASDCVGADVTLTVQASGSLPLEYQWTQDGTPKLNANDLALTPIKATDGGKYIVEIKNSCGTATSKEVTVEVTTNVTPKVSLTTKNDTVLCGTNTNVKLKAYALQGGGKNPKYTFEVAGVPFPQDPTKDSLELPIPENTTDAVVTIPVIVTLESNSTCLAGTPFAKDTITFIVDPIVKPAMFNITEVKDTICVANRNLTVGNLPTNYLGLWTSTKGADATNGNVTNISKGDQTLTTYSVSSPLKKCAALSDTVTTLHSADPTAPAVTVDNVKSKEICISDKVMISGASVSSAFEKANWSVVPNSTRLANGETSFDASGTYKYYLTISNPSSGCKPSIDSATVKVDALPDVANAGPNENMCGEEYVLKGNNPTIGKGKWTSNNLAVTFQDGVDSLFNSVAINMPKASTITFTWQIDNGKCIGTPKTVEITRFGDIVKPIAGLTDDTTICVGGSANLVAKSEANTSNGEWHKWLNPAKDSINNTRIASSGILNNEGKFIYYYAISNKLCGSQLDSFIVNVDAATPVAVLTATLVSGKEYTLVECTEKVASLPGTMPTYGTAMWKKDVLSGGQGTIVDPSSATSEFNGLVLAGQKSVLYWWQKNGVCEADSAKLTVDKPAIISPATITLQDGTGNTLTSKDICAGSNYVLKAGDIKSDKGESYVWSRVNGSSVDLSSDKTTQNQALTLSTSLTNADVTQIRLTIKPPVGVPCPEDTISVKLAVHTVPSGYTIDGTTALCEDASADFTLKTIASTLPITKYNWKVSSTLDGATFVSQDDNLQKATYKFEAKNNVTPFTSGIVIANVANKCGNGLDKNAQSVTINLRPRNLNMSLVLPANPEICSSETGTINYSVTILPNLPASTSINWYWNSSKFATTSTTTTTLPLVQYFNKTGNFTLQAKLENICGESKATDLAWSNSESIKVNPSQNLAVTVAPAPTFSDSVCVSDGGKNTYLATPITNGNNLSKSRTYTFIVTDTNGTATSFPTTDSIFVANNLNDGDEVSVVLNDPKGCFDAPRMASSTPTIVNGFMYPSSTIIPSATKVCEDNKDIELKVIRTKNRKGESNDAGVKWFRNGKFLSQYDTTKNIPIWVRTPEESGKYTVKVKGSVCPDSLSKDSLKIKVYEKPEFSFYTDPFTIIYKEGTALPMPVTYTKLPINDTATNITAKWNAENSKYDVWLLKPDSLHTLISTTKEQTEFYYNLTVTTGDKDSTYCSTSNNIFVINSLPLIVPNAFSPNGDGVNDTWVITGLNKYKNITISVFNRWGNRVFIDQDGYKTAWDGNVNGIPLASGTYYAILELSGSPDNSDQNFTRSLTIVR